MKTTLRATTPLLLIILLANLPVNGQPPKEGYTINGTIRGVDSGMVRMLSRNGNTVLDSSAIEGGKFRMQGRTVTPAQFLFNIAPGNWNFLAFVEEAPITLLVDTAGAEHRGREGDRWALIHEVKQTGSPLADAYTRSRQETRQDYYLQLFSGLGKELRTEKGNEAAEARIRAQMDSVKNVYFAIQKAWIEAYISREPSSIAGVYLLAEYCGQSPDLPLAYLDSMLTQFTGAAATSPYYSELFEKAAHLRSRQQARAAPDFTLLQRDRTPFTLSATRGKYTLIDFWASWCVPCRKAIPAWKEVYTRYKDRGFTIVSISNDRHWTDWVKALNKEQMPWVQVIDEFPPEGEGARVAKLFDIEPMPFYVLLDKEGKVILASGEEEAVRGKIEELFR